MRRYIRKCKGIGEIAVMEVAAATHPHHHHHQVGVMTRARALAIAAASARASKKKSIGNRADLQYSSSTSAFVQLPNRRRLLITPENRDSPASSGSSSDRMFMSSGDNCSSPCSNRVAVSRCSSHGSSELVMSESLMRSVADLKGGSLEFESSTYSGCRERRETTPSSNLRSESEDLEFMERPSVVTNARHRSKEERMPSAAEIEEFFSAAEKHEQKRFAEKYNFDIVKDAPLEGRYEWVQMKP